MTLDDCKNNQIRNPVTKRCVSKTGKAGLVILNPILLNPKECKSHQILNPVTKRCVSKTGKAGLDILNPVLLNPKECKSHQILNPVTKKCISKTSKAGLDILNPIENESVEQSPKPLISYGCNKIGMMQSIGTCWFNAIFNNLLLSQKCYSFFLNKYNELPETDKIIIENKSLYKTCPLKLQRYDFYYYFYKYHLNRSKIMELINLFFKSKKTQNAQKLINKLDIRSPGWEKTRQGFNPGQAIQKILPIIMNSDDYVIYNINLKKPLIISKKTKFIFIKETIYIKTINDPRIRIPTGFVLDHVVIGITFIYNDWTKNSAHAISGYVCNNEYYIYDSNNYKYCKLDWRDPENIKEYKFLDVYKKDKTVELKIGYSYLCYIKL